MRLFSVLTSLSVGWGIFLSLPQGLADPKVRTSENLIARMTLSQKVGQLLFIGLVDKKLSPRMARDLTEIKPGAIILFKKNMSNFKQTYQLTSSLHGISQRYSRLPLLIATDQEGGRVARVSMKPPMPSPLAVGMTGHPEIVEAISFESGKQLRRLGFNMNLAPVLDVLIESGPSFIGERSFGSSPDRVSEFGLAFAHGQLRAGIIPTSKHFPGSGLMIKDPHIQSVAIDEISSETLFPFKQFSQIYPSAIMISHSSYPKLDSSGSPATFSKTIVSDILLRDLSYTGLVLTDDLRMGSVSRGGKGSHTLARNAIKAFKAGADLLMITWGSREQKIVKRSLIEGVRNGTISKNELNKRVKKILKIKEFLTPAPPFPVSAGEREFESDSLKTLDEQILKINLSRELSRLGGKITPKGRFAVSLSKSRFRWSFEQSLGRPVGIIDDIRLFRSSEKPGEISIQNEFDCVIVPVYSKKEALLLSFATRSLREKIIAVNFTSPGFIQEKALRGVINLYHPHASAGRLLGELVKNLEGISVKE